MKPEIEKLIKEYNLTEEDFWKMSRRNKDGSETVNWIMLHSTCEKIAHKKGIKFHFPTITVADGMVVYTGEATLDDETIWASGEGSKANSFIPYPASMAEKRLKDRLTLKLIRAYEYGVYSEIEADQFKREGYQEAKEKAVNTYNPKTEFMPMSDLETKFQKMVLNPAFEGKRDNLRKQWASLGSNDECISALKKMTQAINVDKKEQEAK